MFKWLKRLFITKAPMSAKHNIDPDDYIVLIALCNRVDPEALANLLDLSVARVKYETNKINNNRNI